MDDLAAKPLVEDVLDGPGLPSILDRQTGWELGLDKAAEPRSLSLHLREVLLGTYCHSNDCEQEGSLTAITGCGPKIAITKKKLQGNSVSVTVKTSVKGVVTITGAVLKGGLALVPSRAGLVWAPQPST
jgi:hypothetical protein